MLKTLKKVFTAFLLGSQYMEKNLATLLFVFLRKALNTMLPLLCKREMDGLSITFLTIARFKQRLSNRELANMHEQ